MSDTSSIDSFPAADDTAIEEEEIIFYNSVNVNRDVQEDYRAPKTIIGKKAESLLQAIRSALDLGHSEGEVEKQFIGQGYSDKNLSGFQSYYKTISEKVKDRISYNNSEMIKKISKYDDDSEAKKYYYQCQCAPIEELIRERNSIIVPAIKELQEQLELKKLELLMLEVFIKIQHPEATTITYIQKLILVSKVIILYHYILT